MQRHLARVLALGFLVAAIAACDGGKPNTDPVASFTANPTTGLRPLAVAFDASASRDPHGRIVSYSWNFGDASAAGAGAVTNHTFQEAGSFSVVLTVTDDSGRTATATQTVVVSEPQNQLPTAEFTMAPIRFAVPLEVYFDAAASGDPDGSLVNYEWAFGDGESTQVTSKNATHRYKVAGAYTVTLKVTDDRGGTATATSTATVPLPFYKVTNLGSLGGGTTTGYGINDAGVVVGVSQTAEKLDRAFAFDGKIRDLGTLPGSSDSGAFGVDEASQIVGRSGGRPVIWSNGVVRELLVPPVGHTGTARAIDSAGGIVGEISRDQWCVDRRGPFSYGFLMRDGVRTDLGSLGIPYVFARDVNGSSEVVGSAAALNFPAWCAGYSMRAFRWRAGLMTDLGTLQRTPDWNSAPLTNLEYLTGTRSAALAVNDAGSVAGYSTQLGLDERFPRPVFVVRGFLLTGDLMYDLGSLGGGFSTANDINAEGTIVGAADDVAKVRRAMLVSEATLFDLNRLIASRDGPTLREATAINDRGQIVANGCDGSGCYSYRLDPLFRPAVPGYCASASAGNRPPVAVFALAPARAPNPVMVEFDALASTDPEGGPLSYRWDFGDGTGAIGSMVKRPFFFKGVHTIRLEVRDECGARTTAERQLEVLDGPPIMDIQSSTHGLLVTVSATVFDPDSAYQVAWSFGDGSTAIGEFSVQHTYATAGTYLIKARVTDTAGNSVDESVEVTVAADLKNQPPVPSLTVAPPSGISPLEVTVDASGSTDDYPGPRFTWSFGDGGSASGVTATHVYRAPGTYTIVLEMADQGGLTATARAEVVVFAAAGPDSAISVWAPDLGEPLQLQFRAPADADDSGSRFDWDFGDGERDTGRTVTHSFRSPGVYQVTVVVTSAPGSVAVQRADLRVAMPQFQLTDLSDLQAAEGPRAMNEAGDVVGYRWSDGRRRAAVIRGGSIVDIGTLGGSASAAVAINDAGWVAGNSEVPDLDPPAGRGFLYRDGNLRDLGSLGGNDSSVIDMNDRGQIVGISGDGRISRFFLYEAGQMRPLWGWQEPEWQGSCYILALNNSGLAAGSARLVDTSLACTAWLATGEVRLLGTLGTDSGAVDINDLGQATGSSTTLDGEEMPFLYQAGNMVGLGSFAGGSGRARAINSAGAVVGQFSLAGDANPRAFLFEGGLMQDLNLLVERPPEFRLFEATAINGRGQILAFGCGDSAEGLLCGYFRLDPP